MNVGKKVPNKIHEKYFEVLGQSPEGILSAKDFYRFRRVRQHILGDSVLDVGCARADFLKSIKSHYRIAGIEATDLRAQECNTILGENAVKAGNIEEGLPWSDNSFDTVTSMEVLEHLVDPQKALEELIRISKKRVIITVPFNDAIKHILCVHCANYTPYSGHFHSFNRETIKRIIPANCCVKRIDLIHNRFLDRFMLISAIDAILNAIVSRADWMMVVIDKTSATHTA